MKSISCPHITLSFTSLFKYSQLTRANSRHIISKQVRSTTKYPRERPLSACLRREHVPLTISSSSTMHPLQLRW